MQVEILLKKITRLCYRIKYRYDHIRKVIKEVPQDRLLIIQTENLNNSWHKVANFLGINSNTIEQKNSWSGYGLNNRQIELDNLIKREYLENLILKHKKDIEFLLR
jgi:hypothetical protein